MKKGIVIALTILIIVIISVFMIQNFKRNIKISDIKSLNFYYSQGYMMNSGVGYNLECKEECVLSYKAHGVSFDEPTLYKVDDSIILEIEDLLNKYKVSRWDGFNKSNKHVLDGDSFNFSISMQDGKHISASGYMMWPQHYREVKEGLNNIFAKVIK